MKKYIKSLFQQRQNPAKEIGVAEVCGAFTYQEHM